MSTVSLAVTFDVVRLSDSISESMSDDDLVKFIVLLDSSRAEYSFSRLLVRELCKSLDGEAVGNCLFDKCVRSIAKTKK